MFALILICFCISDVVKRASYRRNRFICSSSLVASIKGGFNQTCISHSLSGHQGMLESRTQNEITLYF